MQKAVFDDHQKQFVLFTFLKIIVIRDLAYNLPSILPPEWKEFESILRSPHQLIWMAEYNAACIEELVQRIGPSQDAMLAARQLLNTNPSLIQTIRDRSTLELNPHMIRNASLLNVKDIVPGILSEVQRRHVNTKLNSLRIKSCKLEGTSLFFAYSTLHLSPLDDEPSDLTDQGLKFLADGLPHVTRLTLSRCSKVTDNGIRYLASGCKNIVQLQLNECNITDVGMKFLAEGCHVIEILDVSRCNKITELGLRYLADSCTNMRQLNMSYCTSINDAGVKYLADRCWKIQELILAGCPVTDEAAKCIAEGMKSIKQLDMSFTKIKNAITYIGQGGQHLCPMLMGKEMNTRQKNFVKNMWNLYKFHMFFTKFFLSGIHFFRMPRTSTTERQ